MARRTRRRNVVIKDNINDDVDADTYVLGEYKTEYPDNEFQLS